MRSFICVLLACLMLLPFSVHAESDPEFGDNADSWRYTDGVLSGSNIQRTQYEASHPDATLQGIDVSHHQEEINWEKVKASGIDFAIIRCGYGMDMEEQDDRYFEYNASECERLGIPYGVYIYSYADTVERAISEADHVLRLIQGHTLSYPVFYDMEDDSIAAVGNDELAVIAATFCDKIAAAGYPVGIYANAYWWDTYLTDPVFDNWYRWVAMYNSTCTYQGEYTMWQYSCTGNVDGISGNVDLNFQIGWPEDHGINTSITLTTDRQVYDFLDPIYVSANCYIGDTWIGMYKQGESYTQNDSVPILRCAVLNETPINIRSYLSESDRADDFGVGEYTLVLFRDSKSTVLKTVNISITKKAVSQDRVEATCSQEGSVTITYSDGSTEIQSLPKLSHTEESIPGRNAGCTDTGLTEGIRCSLCQTILVAQTPTDALGHRWDEGIVTVLPTETQPGVRTYTCKACRETRTEEIPCIVPPRDVDRIYGNSRVTTAIEVANKMKEVLNKETFDAIIIANGDNFADALTGSYLANVKGAPILLYRASGIEQNETYIQENLSKNGVVYILGGTAAVPANVEERLVAASYNVQRVYGDTRFDTNLQILKATGVANQEILICTGWDYADSMAASATGLPIVMVNTKLDTLTESQIAFFRQHADKQFTIVGGTFAVSQKLESDIEVIVGDVDRVFGISREDTSVAIAERYFSDPDCVLIAYSRNFPDGLCGGPLANAMGAPLILVNAGREAAAVEYVAENGIAKGIVLGGTLAISDETVQVIFGE